MTFDPHQSLQQLLQPMGIRTTLFPPSSRYYDVETTTLVTSDARKVVYLRRRFVPPPENFALLQEHVVSEGERLDHLAFQYLGNSELFWQICDANAAVKPEELTERPGRGLRITMPEGIPGLIQGPL